MHEVGPKEELPLYELSKVTKDYVMGEVVVHALRETDLTVRGGEILVILGPSGSGKSTLLHLLGGMESPTTGSIFFRGNDISGAASDERTLFRRRSVGFVFQFYNLVPSLTAVENVSLASEIAPQKGRDPAAMLDLVGLKDRASHFPSQLSGGEQQRVAIARAVAKAPEVLLCDEPTGALDFPTGKIVLGLLLQVNRDLKTTVILITHNAAIAGMGDRVVHMRSGRIVSVEKNETRVSPEEIVW